MRRKKNKGYKIENYGRIFDSSHRQRKKKTRNAVILVISLVLLGFLGFSISGPLSNLLKGEKTERPNNTSSAVSSNIASSGISSSEKEEKVSFGNLKVAYMPVSVLTNDETLNSYLDKIKALGYNSVVVELKDEVGTIYYKTSNELALSVGAVAENAVLDIKASCEKIKAKGIVPIAQINAFKDKTAAKSAEAKILYTGQAGWSWLDAENGKPWLNPYSSVAQQYITSLSCELAGFGFENILVSNITFPQVSYLMYADFGPFEQSISHRDILAQYTSALKEALNQKNAKLLLGFDGAAAFRENNVVYGGSNPITFVADAYVPYFNLPADSGFELSTHLGNLRKLNLDAQIMAEISSADKDGVAFSKEEIDAQRSVCAGCAVYVCDKNGNYVG